MFYTKECLLFLLWRWEKCTLQENKENKKHNFDIFLSHFEHN